MFLLFDLGATKTRIAFSRNGRAINDPLIIKTPRKFSEGMAFFRSLKKDTEGRSAASVVSGGVPGSLSADRQKIFNAPNLPDWSGKPLARELAKIFSCRNVLLLNDTAACGLGEAVYGAGRGARDVVYYTMSTGINGVWVRDGRIMPSVFGFETGHQVVAGKDKTMMDLVSGASLMKRYGKPPEEITDKAAWKEATHYLAVGIYNSLLHWAADKVVVGGGLMNKISLSKVEAEAGKLMKIFPSMPPFQKAELGDASGLMGALAHAHSLL